MNKEKENTKEEIDEHLKGIKCSKCGSNELKLSVDRSFKIGYIKCKDCGNYDTRKIINGELSDLVKCDKCGSSTTKIVNSYGYSYPLWHFDLFEHLDIEVLCDKCKEAYFDEFTEKEKILQRKESENRIKELEEKYKQEEKDTKTISITEHELNYILGLIENDDDFATEMCLNLDIEDEYEFKMSEKIFENWQSNIKRKLESVLIINKKI